MLRLQSGLMSLTLKLYFRSLYMHIQQTRPFVNPVLGLSVHFARLSRTWKHSINQKAGKQEILKSVFHSSVQLKTTCIKRSISDTILNFMANEFSALTPQLTLLNGSSSSLLVVTAKTRIAWHPRMVSLQNYTASN